MKTRGYYFVNMKVTRNILIYVACFYNNQHSGYDLTNLTIIDWTAWVAIAITCFILAFIAKSHSIGINVLGVWICTDVNLNRFDRRLVASFLVPIAFFGIVYQSLISSDSTRLREIPESLSFVADKGYKIWAPNRELLEWFAYKFLPQKVKDDIAQSLKGHEFKSYLTSQQVPLTNLSDMVRFMAQNKIASYGILEEYLFFTNFVKENKILVDNKYVCVTIDNNSFERYEFLIFRFSGYMSARTGYIFRKWIEIGEFQKMQKLSDFLNSRHKSLQYPNVIYLNKLAPPQAIDSESIVGFSCYGMFAVGCGLFMIRLLYKLIILVKLYFSMSNFGLLQVFRKTTAVIIKIRY